MHGQVVMGPPGSGKSTYCKAVQEHLMEEGRQITLVNLDPGNDCLIYNCSIDVCDLIRVEEAMQHEGLGPNGGMIFCMEHLEQHLDWLLDKIKLLPHDAYVLFDCPGQIELYTHNEAVHNIVHHLIDSLKINLVAIFIVDSAHLGDTSTFISLLTTTLLYMLRIELPSISLLGKSDLIDHHQLPFPIDYFTDVLDLQQLLAQDTVSREGHKGLMADLVGVVERYGLVSFRLLSVVDEEVLKGVVESADKLCLYKKAPNKL